MFENYLDKIKRYFWFSKTELNGFLLTTFVFAFIYSFNKWGAVSFDAKTGISNLIIGIFLCGSGLFVHHAGQRLMALKLGVKAEHKVWWPGLIIALVLAVLSYGKITVYAASAVFITLLPQHRLGGHRYMENVGSLAKTALAGPVLNIILGSTAIILNQLGVLPDSVSTPIFMFNLYFAAWNLIPIPPLDGSRIIYYSRLVYVFLVSSLIGYIALIALFSVYSYIWALLIGVICWFLFLYFFEMKANE